MFGRATRVESELEALWLVVSNLGRVESVFRDRCAHMGSPLRWTRSGFMCDSHGWSYRLTGRNDVDTNPGLEALEFSQSGNIVRVTQLGREELLPRLAEKLGGEEKLELLSHASFMLTAGENRILFDPWLVGDTYWGAWRQFPKFDFDISELERVTSVVISHPHPDHFHPETLGLLPRSLPIYFPNFPSAIIPRVLEKLDFSQLYPTDWEIPVDLGGGVSFAFLRPNSVWEDAAVLVRVKDWVWLNQNDAGAPLRDNLLPESLDLLSSAFDVGASGYPLTWDMPSRKADAILVNAHGQLLKNIGIRCRQTRARYFSPFAGWWRHARPEHQEFAQRLPHTRMSEVEEVVRTAETGFLETLPGSQILLKTMDLTVPPAMVEALDERWEVTSEKSSEHGISEAELTLGLEKKLKSLARMSDAVGCEYIEFTVCVDGSDIRVSQIFGTVNSGKKQNIDVIIPYEIASRYVLGDETVTWNHIDIGYWGRWARQPDVYPVQFMRLLQLGYVPSLEATSRPRLSEDEVMAIPLGTIFEKNPQTAGALLSRAGLPCGSCVQLKAETLGDAVAMHAVEQTRAKRLYTEVRALLSS